MRRRRREYLRTAEDDGLPAAVVGAWAEEKYRRLGLYADMFSTGMKNKWDLRVYVDLFSGPGHAIIKETGRRVLTSAVLAADVPDPFDCYVLCDREAAYVHAVEARVRRFAPNASVIGIVGDANRDIESIVQAIPSSAHGQSVLTFCFVDPFNLEISFDAVRALAEDRAIDFLFALMVPIDAGRNEALYASQEHPRIDRLLGDADWRQRWDVARANRVGFRRFVAEEYAAAMGRLGYVVPALDRMYCVRLPEKNVPLYYVAFFSRNQKGYKFWDDVLRYSTDQTSLDGF